MATNRPRDASRPLSERAAVVGALPLWLIWSALSTRNMSVLSKPAVDEKEQLCKTVRLLQMHLMQQQTRAAASARAATAAQQELERLRARSKNDSVQISALCCVFVAAMVAGAGGDGGTFSHILHSLIGGM